MTTSDTLELPDFFEPEPPRAPKRRWRRVILVVTIVIVVLAVLAALAELLLRLVIPTVIESTLREQLQLSAAHPVEVEIQGSTLLPALTGQVGETTVTVPDVLIFEGIEATLRAEVKSMPFDPTSGEIVGATASATIPSSSMNTIVSLVTGGLADAGDISAGEVIVGRTIEIFGMQVAVNASLHVSIEDGDLLIQPTAIKAAGFDLTAEQLRPYLGDVAAGVLDVHTICIRDQLPAGITVTDLDFSQTPLGGATATITAALDRDILSNPKKQLVGSCSQTS